MKTLHKNVIIIGGGPAGLAAAVELRQNGVKDLLILERERHLGGILRQCIHDGFGLTRFGRTLSGPEYAERFIAEVEQFGLEYRTGATVLNITPDRTVTAAMRDGLLCFSADAVILAMGCRERTRGALAIPGERPTGVFTAGVAQTYLNLQNTMVGKNAVILGSGDIGMIMARRLTLEGAKVQAVFEILPYPSGLPRNIEQCLNDYNIPLFLSHTVTRINGKARLESVLVNKVDQNGKPIPKTEKEYPCDTLILSVGLIPENELSLKAGVALDPQTLGPMVDENYQTNVRGIFAAGNVLHVHDLVDFVSLEAEKLARAVSRYLNGGLPEAPIEIRAGDGVGHVVPQRLSGELETTLSFRVRRPLQNCTVELWQDNTPVASKRFKRIIPAEMEQIVLSAAKLISKNRLKVVARVD